LEAHKKQFLNDAPFESPLSTSARKMGGFLEIGSGFWGWKGGFSRNKLEIAKLKALLICWKARSKRLENNDKVPLVGLKK